MVTAHNEPISQHSSNGSVDLVAHYRWLPKRPEQLDYGTKPAMAAERHSGADTMVPP
jgi:hypothetical protein